MFVNEVCKHHVPHIFVDLHLLQVDIDIKTSGVFCSLCLADPAMDKEAKDIPFTLYQLAQQQLSKSHTHREQLSRAFKPHLIPPIPCSLAPCDSNFDKKSRSSPKPPAMLKNGIQSSSGEVEYEDGLMRRLLLILLVPATHRAPMRR